MKVNTMNFRQLEAFRALMVSGTASRAAELLGVTQPAISRSVIELERSTGILLFDRVLGRMLPTPEGRAFYQDVADAFGELERLKNAAARIRDYGSGQLRVACLSSLGAKLLPAALQRFHQRQPEVRLSFQIQSSVVVRDLVASGQFDVGIAADEVNTSGVVHQPFASYTACIAMPPGHRLASRTAIQPEDLDGEDFIAIAPEDTARRKMDAVLKEAGVNLNIVMETHYSVTVARLVKNGMGIGLVNPIMNFGERDPELVLVPFDPAIAFRKLLLYPPDRQRSKLTREFVKELVAVRNESA